MCDVAIYDIHQQYFMPKFLIDGVNSVKVQFETWPALATAPAQKPSWGAGLVAPCWRFGLGCSRKCLEIALGS